MSLTSLVRTLNPARLLPTDIIHTLQELFPTLYYDFRAPNTSSAFVPFPNGIPPGFLYYHNPPTVPPPAHGIRFRLASSVEKFGSGTDLLNPNGLPWEIPTYILALTPSLGPLLSTLILDDSLVPLDLVRDVRSIYPAGWATQRPFYCIHSLGELFSVRLNRRRVLLNIAGPRKVRAVEFYTEFLGPGPYKVRPHWYDGPVHVSIDHLSSEEVLKRPLAGTREHSSWLEKSRMPMYLSSEQGEISHDMIYLDPKAETQSTSPTSLSLAHNQVFAGLPSASSPLPLPALQTKSPRITGTFITTVRRAPLRWPEFTIVGDPRPWSRRGPIQPKWEIRPNTRSILHVERWSGRTVEQDVDRSKLGLLPLNVSSHLEGVDPSDALAGLLEWEQLLGSAAAEAASKP